jgi:hypothetical protein
MNVAGKSLQDIYDAGSRRLDELEQAEKTNLADAADAHLDERSRVEPDALKRLEERTDDLEKEIRAFLARGIERVQKSVEVESQESEQHITRLVEGLVLCAKKFSESIAQLRKMAESQLTDQGEDCQHVFSLHAQTSSSELLHEGTVAVAEARQELVSAERKIGQQIEEAWEAVYEKDTEGSEALGECFDTDSAQVWERFEQSRRSLEERAQERLSQLEEQGKASKVAIKALVDHVVEQADRFSFDTDVKLKEGFSSQLYELTTSFDDSAARAAGEMSSLHESSMADLTMKSQELSREMDSLSENITKAANDKSIELQDNANSLQDRYTGELNAKLEAGNVFHKDLASERAQMVSEIWSELTELRQRFDDKLKNLSTTTLDKMRSICEDAETAIVTAQHNCCSDSKGNAATKQEAIDSAAREFLRRIEQTRKVALDGIAKAAGEDPGNSNSKDNSQKSKKSQRADAGKSDAAVDADTDAVEGGDASDDAEDEQSEEENLRNPRPGSEAEDGRGESRKRRKNKSDKRSAGESKK